MNDAKPGDKVLCVWELNGQTPGILPHWLCGAEIVKGRIYTIENVIRGVDNCEEETTGFTLIEPETHFPQRNGSHGAYAERHFAPIKSDGEEIGENERSEGVSPDLGMRCDLIISQCTIAS